MMSDNVVWGNDGTKPILDSIFEVYNNLGPGMLESVYERALMLELKSRGINAQNQVPVRAFYKGVDMNIDFRLDILVEDSIVLEIKSVEQLLPVHEKQLLTYLKLTDKHLGLLVNFNESYLKRGIKRIVNGFKEPAVEMALKTRK
jgi:GxxExxY protein